MSKILSARDLLDLVRQREDEERQETETVDSGRAQGRRIYPGTTKRARPRRPEQPAPGRRPRNNTQLLEQPRGQAPNVPGPTGAPPARGVPPRAPDRSRLPPAERGRDEQLDPPTPLLGVPLPHGPVPGASGLAPPITTPAMRRQPTVQMPRGAKAEAKPATAPPPRTPRDPEPPRPEDVDEESTQPTLEIEVPREMFSALQAEPAQAPPAAPPEKPTRKTSSQSWVRPSETPISQAPPSPPRQPSLAAKPTRSVTPTPVAAMPSSPPAAAPPPAPAAAAQPPEPPPPSDPSPTSPARGSVASMFSWVTQKPDWAPVSKPLAPSVPPPATVTPASTPPPTIPMSEPIPESARSVVADEPIALSSEETLVLIHYDAAAQIDEMAERTGLSEWRVEKIVEALKSRGVLDEETESQPGDQLPAAEAPKAPEPPKPPPPPPKPPDPPKAPEPPKPPPPPPKPPADISPVALSALAGAAPGKDAAPPSSRPVLALEPDPEEAPARDRERTLLELELEAFVSDDSSKLEAREAEVRRAKTEEIEAPPDTETTIVDDGPNEEGPASADPKATKRAEEKPSEPSIPASASSAAEAAADDAEAEEDDRDKPSDDEVVGGADEQGGEAFTVKTLLAYWENVLSKLPGDERAKIATTSGGQDLYALAFDKDPQVVRALWQNVNISNEHARFAAFHHRTALGLELIAQKNEFLRDPQIQRRFIRNPMVSETLLRKMLLPKRLLEIYKVTLDREAGERTRQSSRALLRNKFAVTEPEDRLELIWKTEGRALTALSGLSIDSKTAALICARPLVSLMLVQSFCRFAATPPSVIHHFLKQNIVKRQVHLRNALLKHPNCPSDAKRAF